MKKIAIMTDTNSGLTTQDAQTLDVSLVPMPFLVDGQIYFEGVDMTAEEFFQRQSAGAEISTSQPSPGDLLALWDEVLETADELVYIPMSSGLSSSCEMARGLSTQYDGRVRVADVRRISVTQEMAVYRAAALRNQGLDAGQIADQLEAEALEASIYVCVGNLTYLKKGGRITPAVAALGTLMDIKPVLQIQGGKLDTYKKVRGMRQAKKCLTDAIQKDLDTRFAGMETELGVAYAGEETEGLEWNAYVQEAFPGRVLRMARLPISIACHVGPGTLGITVTKCY